MSTSSLFRFAREISDKWFVTFSGGKELYNSLDIFGSDREKSVYVEYLLSKKIRYDTLLSVSSDAAVFVM